MINRENWLDTCKYLTYLEQVKQQDKQTIARRRNQLRHLLEWADSSPLPNAKTIFPTFPTYLLSARNDGKNKPQSASTMKSTCQAVQRFFIWGRMTMPRKYAVITPDWLETIDLPKSRGMQSEYKVHEFYTFEEMQKIAAFVPETLREEREQAAMAFLFLSGMRVSAFASLPISCVDLEERSVDQFPGMGVRTKNHKAAKTFLLPIPELLEVVQSWDDKVRSLLPADSMWYAFIDTLGENLISSRNPCENRDDDVNKGIMLICNKLGMKYRSAHKFRHGHVVYGLKGVKNMAGLKAVSQNVMHGSVQITDGIYGNLNSADIQEAISKLNPKRPGTELDPSILDKLMGLTQVLIQHPEILEKLKDENS